MHTLQCLESVQTHIFSLFPVFSTPSTKPVPRICDGAQYCQRAASGSSRPGPPPVYHVPFIPYFMDLACLNGDINILLVVAQQIKVCALRALRLLNRAPAAALCGAWRRWLRACF